MSPTLEARYLGCLLGAAIGDAAGVRAGARRGGDPDAPPGIAGATTQLILFTGDGLLRAHNRVLAIDAAVDPVPVVHRAYLRWLETQRQSAPPPRADGWLAGQAVLYRRRDAPHTTTQALRTGLVGHPDRPINNARDASVIARSIPAGLGDWPPFALARDLAAITHTHPSAYLAAAAFAHLLQSVVLGAPLVDAAESAYTELEAAGDAEGLLRALDDALDAGDLGDPTPERVVRFGDGRSAESAFAIGVYCASATDSFVESISAAAGHPGPGSWSASLAGALRGALGGAQVLPTDTRLELQGEVEQLAHDFWRHFAAGPFEPGEEDWNRYPG